MLKNYITRLIDSLEDAIYSLLQHPRKITIEWDIQDVRAVRPDLNLDQSWAVLKRCSKSYDCSVGINWNIIEQFAQELFPESED